MKFSLKRAGSSYPGEIIVYRDQERGTAWHFVMALAAVWLK